MTSEKFASAKLRREFVAWLKVEAARAGVPMYEFVEREFAPKRGLSAAGTRKRAVNGK